MPLGREPEPNDIRVEAFLADDVQASEGKLYVLGLGWNKLFAPSAPVMHPRMGVGILIRVPYTRTNEEHTISIEIVDADNNPIPMGPGGQELADPSGAPVKLGGGFTVGRPPDLRPGDEQLIPMAMQLDGIVFPVLGRYALRVLLDGDEAFRLPFKVEPRQNVTR